MELRARTRHAGLLAALTALLVPAVAGTATAEAAKAPVVKRITPKHVFVGDTLTLRGRHFRRGIEKNTVAFKRRGAKVVLVRAGKSTAKLLKVKLPKRLEKALLVRSGAPVPTRLQVRVLAYRFGKRFTRPSLSPIVGPERPPAPPRPPGADPAGDCDTDGQLNGVDADDDNDLLSDALEYRLRTDQCKPDSDGDGVTDGYEYQSARDLNDDEYQEPQTILPAPRSARTRTRCPPTRTSTTTATRCCSARSSRSGRPIATRRPVSTTSSTPTATSTPPTAATAPAGAPARWSAPTRRPSTPTSSAGPVRPATARSVTSTGTARSPRTRLRYFDLDLDIKLSDDERDEDADGLTNYDEATGRNTSGYWAACYKSEKPYRITYAGTDFVDPDSDGDTVRDGADDQDNDDVANLMELSRRAAAYPRGPDGVCGKDGSAASAAPAHGRVNPYNPCLPYVNSRTCERHPAIDNSYAPFDDSPNYLILN